MLLVKNLLVVRVEHAVQPLPFSGSEFSVSAQSGLPGLDLGETL